MDGARETGPAEDQLADRCQNGADGHDRRRSFGSGAAGLGILGVAVYDAAPERFGEDGDHRADAYADEGEAGDSRAPAAFLGEDDGVGYEGEVQDAVDDGDPVVRPTLAGHSS